MQQVDTERAGKLSVTVRLVEGESADFHVSPEMIVSELKRLAIQELGVEPAPGVTYYLALGGKKLDDSITLSAAGVTNKATLILATEPQVGAASR
jgi:hypothetical protein